MLIWQRVDDNAFHLRPDRRAIAGSLGEGSGDDPDFYFARYRGFADLGRCGRTVMCYAGD